MSREMISVGIVAILVIIALLIIAGYNDSLNNNDLTGVAVSEICISNNQCNLNKRCVNNICREMFVPTTNPQTRSPSSLMPPIKPYIYTDENFFIPTTPVIDEDHKQNLNNQLGKVQLGSTGCGDCG